MTNSKLLPILIAAPFGNHIRREWASSVGGTFTYKPRPGLWKQVLKTLRPYQNGWINNIGLRNPGIGTVTYPTKFDVLSIGAIQQADFNLFLEEIPCINIIELNLSCPNVDVAQISDHLLGEYKKKFYDVIVKLPPDDIFCRRMVDRAVKAGITTFHCCNTIPTDKGGVSGPLLKLRTIPIIEKIRASHPDITIIGGGGIYTPDDVKDYYNAGADHYSLATIFLTPWKVKPVRKMIEFVSGDMIIKRDGKWTYEPKNKN